MIAKRIDRKPEVRDDYANLGRYIAAAKEKGEKLDKFWIVGCDAGDKLTDLDLALIEIEATRTLKPGIADKTYHLVVSFHPGEENQLTQDQLQDIERSFAEALGFGEHQRVAGTHINTDNFHMHVAFNKIHPVTGRCHTPRQDFKTLARVAREMERKYGLVVDKGMTDSGTERNPVSRKARDLEAKTWQQSFERHLVEHKAEILKMIDGAGSWHQVHEGLEEYGVALKKRGAGLVFAQTDGKGRMKASGLDRSCSLAKLEERLGPYQPPPEKAHPAPPKKPYRPKPMTRHPAQDRLWRTYTQTKKPGFLARALHIRNWKDYLLAEAHKDALALAIVMTYKELFHMLDEATTPRRQPKAPPRSLKPALATWLDGASWKAPAMTWLKPDLGDMDLKADDTGRVLYPFRDDKGHVWAIRAMDGQGRTADIGDLDKPGLSHVIDPGNDLGRQKAAYDGQVVITSDCLAAAILYKDAGVPVIVVSTDAHLVDQATSIRKAHPKADIVIATMSPHRQAEQAASVAAGTVVVIDSLQAQSKIIADLAAKGRPIAVDPALAREMGAFVEDALSVDDVAEGKPKTPRKPPGRDKGGLGR
ncbi:MAG: relaxase/mobilization nuclease domain-containing protein [Magnetospirillum sp.]|nr:relaxase/mobilization nuclease domain-containing protein [Magnetospirillum sp.]